jgi:hypothetical protein
LEMFALLALFSYSQDLELSRVRGLKRLADCSVVSLALLVEEVLDAG